MSKAPELVNITMVRETLDGVPDLPVPAPYSLRNWRPGDEAAFDDIWLAADCFGQAKRGLFQTEFAANIDAVPERMFFLVDGKGRPVGTATAWWRTDFGEPGENWGVVHWVAVIPEAQGKGLSKPLMTAVLHRMKSLGHERACLVTQTVRLTAISLYKSLGFAPFIRNEADPPPGARWMPHLPACGADVQAS